MGLNILSAFLFVSAFFLPQLFFFGIFLFLIPIFYCALQNKLNFMHGFYWGCVVYLLHLIALFICIWQHGAGRLRMFAPVALVIYFALYSGIWFWLIAKLKSFSNPWSWQIVSLVLPTLLYVWFMYEGVFWIFESWYGYCFTHPLLPLACYPRFLLLAPKLGLWVLTLCLVLFQACIAFFFTTRDKKFIVLSLLAFLPFLYGWLITYAPEQELHDKSVGCLYLTLKLKSKTPYSYALAINNQIEEYLKRHPDVRVIIMPESTFPFALNQCPKSIRIWAENALQEDMHLLIGSFRKQNNNLFNCFFHIHQGRIINFYDKKHLLFFTEQTPQFFWNPTITCTAGNCSLPIFDCGEFRCIPQICSDLFLGHAKDVYNKDIPIVCIADDHWFVMQYAKNLMQLYARFIAKIKEQQVIFVCPRPQ